ncbi:MAG: hypothetical protein K6U80_01165 [Firmicutes bacterium]|nr:hypothetical protein [Bacillota bacterium]
MQAVLNRDLYERQCGGDHFYIIADSPKRVGNHFTVRINLDGAATVIDEYANNYQYNHRVSEIRKGKAGLWLLSGGTIITDQNGRIAVGLRDGNAADPFAFTNIGAGRCDRKLAGHCMEEFESEFILCVQMKPNEGWSQIRFGPATPELSMIRQRIPAIAKWRPYVAPHQFIDSGRLAVMAGLGGPDKITVEWYDKEGIQEVENLSGYVLEDTSNHTIEFRLPVKIDLSSFYAEQIFFAEGSGYALWKSRKEIHKLAGYAKKWGTRLVTPFLEKI